LRGTLHIFPSFSTPEEERHTKKANHPASSEHMPIYPLKQSEHKRRVYFFLRFDSHATHAYTLQPAAPVFVSYGFVLVRVRVRVSDIFQVVSHARYSVGMIRFVQKGTLCIFRSGFVRNKSSSMEVSWPYILNSDSNYYSQDEVLAHRLPNQV